MLVHEHFKKYFPSEYLTKYVRCFSLVKNVQVFTYDKNATKLYFTNEQKRCVHLS